MTEAVGFIAGLTTEWVGVAGEVIRVSHSCGLLVTRTLGKEWLSPRVNPAALEREKARLNTEAIEACRKLYDHKFRLKQHRRT